MFKRILTLALVASPAAAADPVEFNRDVRPILADKCYACHGPDATARKAELRLDTEAGLKASPKKELLARIASHDPKEVMPPAKSEKKLTVKQIATLKAWVEQGSKYQGHWAFEPIQRAKIADRLPQPIDEFIKLELGKQGLPLSAEADPITLIRRLSFDLTGLPPTPEDVAAFAKDPSPQAYAKFVDQYLASPHYGERMAMFWLDLVRYADSVGYHGDQAVAVSPFRDWVIKAFNENMKFDEFTKLQIAGDLLPNPTLDQRVAAAYNRLGMMSAEGGGQAKEYLAKYAAERVRNVSGAWLGVTIGCAECHDHKFDPFGTKDFYKMQAFFADIEERGIYNGGTFGADMPVPNDSERAALDAIESELKAVQANVGPNPQAFGSLLGGTARTPWQTRILTLEKSKADLLKSVPKTLISVPVKPRMIRVLPRGNWMDDSGAVVEPGFPDAVAPKVNATTRLTRIDLAKWLTAKENPLTARVFVNRFWKQFFGAGLSRKLDDLGAQGESPSHPELLDYLAANFIESGWDVKQSVRELVTSTAYKQSSLTSKELLEKDPFNKFVARQARFRLDAELVRDNALAVSGLLVPKVGGPSVKPYQPPGYWAYLNFPGREWQTDTGEKVYRRGLYTHWQRQYLHPSLAAFDAPSREECTADRVRSNTPLQALVLLNDPIYVEAARALAELALASTKGDADRIGWLFQRAVSRPIKPAEKAVLLELLTKHRAEYAVDPKAAEALLKVGAKPLPTDANKPELAAWTSIARTVLNLHATITRN